MTEKTLIEIAVEFNIEINKLRNKINYEKRKGNVIGFKKDGALYLTENDVEQIKILFNVVEKPIELNVELNKKLDFLKTQIEEKDKQIFMLQQALDQQQILTKQVLDDKKELQIELAENQSKSFWQRLFRK